MVPGIDIEKLKRGLINGDRRMVSKAITLIESQRMEDQETKTALLKSIQGLGRSAVKIGITGSPGVGKSTFLNGFVQRFENTANRIAILTIDPSSASTGGSILGDKLRMKNLTEMDQVYIRPSPSKGVLGGINLTTWETVLLCEAAGFDYVFIETVGIGQSEIEVQHLVNEVWYLTMARAGDEIQGIKRGILEVVDRIIVTKADLDIKEAQNTVSLMRQSLKIIQSRDKEAVFYTLSPFWDASMIDLYDDLKLLQPRPLNRNQISFWFARGWQEFIMRWAQSNPHLKVLYERLLGDVQDEHTDYWTAMETLSKEMDDLWRK